MHGTKGELFFTAGWLHLGSIRLSIKPVGLLDVLLHVGRSVKLTVQLHLVQCWHKECVALYLPAAICLHDAGLNKALPVPVPVAARSKAWICGHTLAGIAGSNPAGARMSVSCACRVLSGRVFQHRAYHSSRGVLQIVVCLSVIVKSR